MKFRKAVISDLQEMQEMYIETIKWICKNDYSPLEIDAWISGLNNVERWKKVIHAQYVLLAIIQDKIVGYGTLKDGNYIDFLCVHKDFQRQGIADKVFNQLEGEAIKENSKTITADVSITAKPFFDKKGFTVKAKQKNIRLGVELINYKMEKSLE
jgi:putative acetyltransferase